MLLDDLVNVIETLQQRIRDHGDSLRQNEIRTRTALIDPLLKALGWDVADPGLVTPEYSAGNGRADYALLGGNGNPAAFIEAKHFGEPLERPQHTEQVFTYALIQQVRYAGLTDGNLWVLDNVAEFSGGERRLLQVSIANEPAHQCALKFLLLWRPNLASGQPVAANEPILSDGSKTVPSDDDKGSDPPPPPPGNWKSVAEFLPGTKQSAPTAIRIQNEEEKPINSWGSVPATIAEWLVQTGKLAAAHCPIGHPITNKQVRYIVNSVPVHSNGKEFQSRRQLNNGLFMETNFNADGSVRNARFLLERFGEDAASVQLKLNN